MKYCRKCGTTADDSQNFCGKCGTEFLKEEHISSNCFDSDVEKLLVKNDEKINKANGLSHSNNHLRNCDIIAPNIANQLPMKWYKFLIYFGLFFGSVISILNGISYITGTIYHKSGIETEVLYDTIQTAYGVNLKIIDVLFGICMVAAGIYMLVVRNKLAKFKSDAPRSLLIMYTVNIVLPIAYSVLALFVLGEEMIPLRDFFVELIRNLIVLAVVLFVNEKYFDRRTDLFIN